ncbi:response regulator [Vannielia litorea]|uniref:DNA-binding response regulator, OmpR family, contains REC and winged-helix (WHTH) domain n=1 Tax=Vannielia litorea TaxID=1217970 RepID=A0A1N6EM50_9RHOB|nr:response regulator [Vannielia litorea]SIN84098.1 DNA-binding response regulator, OmpR family, contains REC and winged-helix (wHTH) domain [Vannielia litorea]
MKILAVDDDTTFLALLESVLREAGYDQVETAQNADEAVRLIKAKDSSYDCFLLDICMPGENGIALCRHIRNNPAYRFAPILMLTARLDDASIDAAFKAGATDYVTKPLRGLELGARIRTACLLTDHMKKSFGLEKATEALQTRLDSLVQSTLAEPLDLEARSQCITQRDLEKALCLLPKKVFALAVCAFRVDDIEQIYQDLSQEAFRALLSEVALGISRSIAPRQHYLCYTGDGVFGCVVVNGKRRRSDVPALPAKPGALTVSGEGFEPREIHLSSHLVADLPLQSGSCAVDALRTAVAKVSEKSLMHRLQRDLDRNRLRSGAVVPRRPRLGLSTRMFSGSSDRKAGTGERE